MTKQNYKEVSKKTFDRVADNYERNYMGRHSGKLYEGVLKRANDFGFKSLLDVGCGKGNLLFKFVKSDVKLYGVDISPVMVDYAKRTLNDSADIKIGDSENLPWENNSFDIITCVDSFHHYPNPKNALKEMKRVLRKGGYIVIGESWFPEIFRRLVNYSFKFGRSGDVKIYSNEEWLQMLLDTGFTGINIEKNSMISIIITGTTN